MINFKNNSFQTQIVSFNIILINCIFLVCYKLQLLQHFFQQREVSWLSLFANSALYVFQIALRFRDLTYTVWCQFHQRFSRAFFVQTSFFLGTFWLWRQNFVQKMRAKNVDEIDSWIPFFERGFKGLFPLIFIFFSSSIATKEKEKSKHTRS